MEIIITISYGSSVMKMQFSAPVNRTGHRHNTATEDKQIHSAVSYRANVMLARFKVGNTARGGQTVNVTGQYV